MALQRAPVAVSVPITTLESEALASLSRIWKVAAALTMNLPGPLVRLHGQDT